MKTTFTLGGKYNCFPDFRFPRQLILEINTKLYRKKSDNILLCPFLIYS